MFNALVMQKLIKVVRRTRFRFSFIEDLETIIIWANYEEV